MGWLLNPYRFAGPFVGDAIELPALANANVVSLEAIITDSTTDVLHVPHSGYSYNFNNMGSLKIAKPSDWEQIAQLTAPTSGAFTFSGLSLADYIRVELWLQGIQTGTNETKVLARMRYGGGPTTMSHKYAIRNLTSADGSTSDANGSGATDGKLAGNNSTTYAVGNDSKDHLSGILSIDDPGASGLRKLMTWWGGHYKSNTPEAMLTHALATATETNPITEIVILGSSNLTAGKVTLIGLTTP